MRYYINLFSPETAEAFSKSDRSISGFRLSRKAYIDNQNIQIGDRLICYCTKIQRFIGVLEITSSYSIDNTPIFTDSDDPFTLRFKVKVISWLPLEHGVPIQEPLIWNKLSFTKSLSKDSTKWTYLVFSSPKLWPTEDCKHIEKTLAEQSNNLTLYPFTEADKKKIKHSKIKRIDGSKSITIAVPENDPSTTKTPAQRESIKIQALLAEIGEKFGYKIWLPNSDRSRVLEYWTPNKDILLDELPLVFDDSTLKTIKNIDILWIKRRSIVRAFEVEDTTSIYSGILRMADLLSLQPMLDIKIHIVAPISRREAVLEQISRPVFAFMEKGPLSEICTYIPYDSVIELSKEKRLEHMTDTIIDEFEEYAD